MYRAKCSGQPLFFGHLGFGQLPALTWLKEMYCLQIIVSWLTEICICYNRRMPKPIKGMTAVLKSKSAAHFNVT